jgi:hypothetical protein
VNRGGSELYVRDLVLGLQRRGRSPAVWSPALGPVADEIRAAGVEVIEDLDRDIVEPDLIHGQHHDETLAALARFPDRPGMFVQHGAVPWQEEAPAHPRLLRYVAVDELCRQRLEVGGVAADRIAVVPNGVDLDRFTPREPLPSRPRRALVLSNTAREDGFVPAIRDACARVGVTLDVAGIGTGVPMPDPHHHLHRYDLVFAKARAAMEAIAVGCAVVVVDEPGIAGMVTSDVLPEWLRWNLGRHLMAARLDVDLLCTHIDRYDPTDAARCRDHLRAHRDLECVLDSIIAEHDRVLDAWSREPAPDHRAELRAAAARLRLIGPLRASDEALDWHQRECERLASALGDAASRNEALAAERDAIQSDNEALEVERDALRNRRAVRWVDAVAVRLDGGGT